MKSVVTIWDALLSWLPSASPVLCHWCGQRLPAERIRYRGRSIEVLYFESKQGKPYGRCCWWRAWS